MGQQMQSTTTNNKIYKYRVRDKPECELTLIAPGTELAEAIVNLKNKYGDRLISCVAA
jgi:hypothetical protein